MSESAAMSDEFLWLEDLDSEDAARWVRDRNAETLAAFTHDAAFAALRDDLREVLDSADRIPVPTLRGQYLYNLWKDAEHPRGLWRRTTLERYRVDTPDWQVLLDLDALAEQEGESWVWQGVEVLRPGYDRCLISLSRGGSDASVVREFDLAERAFVADGFTLPEAKSGVNWIDIDHIHVATDFGPGSLTTSGYPRIVKRWRRGTPLSEAVTVFEGDADDVAVGAEHDPTPGFERDLVYRLIDFYRSERYVRPAGGDLIRLDVPDDARTDLHREWLLIRLRSEWTVGAETYPAGAVLVTRLDAFLAGERELTVVFEPDARTSLSYHVWTRNHLILATLADVKSRLEVLTPGADGWSRAPLAGAPEFDHADIVDTDPHSGDAYLLSASGFTHPTTLTYGQIAGQAEILKREPEFFDATGLSVRQFFATSADGIRVPYFVVSPRNAAVVSQSRNAAVVVESQDSLAGRTLLTAYGGFEVSLTPSYDAVIGRGWLARGGTYVVANIRGGGEYGPAWHRSAIRENRPRAYEDLAAVATDLVERGITTPAQLGVRGGSNGGLLTGVMLTRYPELFGAIVSEVPLLDMRRYHLLLAGASWMAEYGDPDVDADWAYLSTFSPYQNVRAGQPYPPVLFATSTRDDRVHPGHARKMVARLREYGYDVSYYENVEGGHGAAADNEQLAFKRALILEFLRQRLK